MGSNEHIDSRKIEFFRSKCYSEGRARIIRDRPGKKGSRSSPWRRMKNKKLA